MVTHHDQDDTRLNALMARWQAPAVPPGLNTRVTARLLEQQKKPARLLPWSPMKLMAATAMAAVVGMLLGVTIPSSEAATDTVTDTTEIIEQLW